jgi:hypothetical protein
MAQLALPPQSLPILAPGDLPAGAACTSTVTDTFELSLAAPGEPERLVSTLHRTRSSAVDNGRAVCIVAQRYDRPEGSDLDSSVALASTLAPLRYSARVGTERQQYAFTAESVAGVVQASDSAPRDVAEAAPRAYFLSTMDLEVVRALPLSLGYSVQFESYNPTVGFHRTALRVVALDTLVDDGRREVAWRIDYDAGAAPTMLWVRQSDQALLRSRSQLPNGAVFWRRRLGAP